LLGHPKRSFSFYSYIVIFDYVVVFGRFYFGTCW